MNGEWLKANQRYLMAAIDAVRETLARARNERRDGAAERLAVAAAEMPSPPAIDLLAGAFRLSPFEREVVLLCAGMELSSDFASEVAAPTFSLALAALPGAHWSAIAPSGPLRAWSLVELTPNEPVTRGALQINERVLHFLTGLDAIDERCRSLLTVVAPGGAIAASQERIAAVTAARLGHAMSDGGELPRIELCGNDGAGARAVAAAVAARHGLRLLAVDAADLPPSVAERDALARLCNREARLSGAAILIEVERSTAEARRSVAAFADRIDAPLFIAARDPLGGSRRPSWRVDVAKPERGEQRELWKRAVADADGVVDRIVEQFDFGARAIEVTAAHALALSSDQPLDAALWDACRLHARPRMEDLAQRIGSSVTWDDLVLPEPRLQTLRMMAGQVRQRATVYDRWGFAARGPRGLGITALFAGSSGTGKTMAAEVLANELRLDLFRVDLSSVVSKYIGETEENLRRVFDAAEEGGAVLLFDEADALFGKRTEVKDSHDRYANLEVSYLLQRMESYRGLAILTTNLRNALDTAFLRRLRFIVDFPFPEADQRQQLWRKTFPPAVPLGALDYAALARLNASGGSIRNIALGAAFLAAGAGEPLGMQHLLRATREEYAKLERPVTDAEVRGWV
jgi:SpoVK/Ycf46/Vps4 family AAA+-type ATPase